MKQANSVLSGYGTTVFEVMSRLAIERGAINLGQGFPDEPGPDGIMRAADEATRGQSNQYPPMMGVPELRQAVARHNRRFYGLEVDWQREVMVTSGATEALAACILALIEPGDEAVVFDPLYDSYLPMLRRAGAVPKVVPLSPPDWKLPREALAAAFSERTKLLLMNTPMNPTGKVFDADELGFIAGLLERHDAYAVCDEVYEHLIFDGRPHLPLITLPGMRERALRIGSAGKTFSMTGWKVGYVTAAPDLLSVVAKAHQFLVFTTPPNLQRAVAWGLDNEEPWYTGLAGSLQRKRDMLQARLSAIGFAVLPTASTYFMNADFRPLGFNGTDVEFCKHLTVEAGVTVVPVSALYATGAVDHLVRFCFCKRDEVLEGALERLERHFAAT
jgi:aspartate/methionine/tyrosine aminotransferase